MNIIIGAGISGLSIAHFLRKKGEDFVIFDVENPGGWCRTIQVNGFRFDLGGHFFHSLNNETQEVIRDLKIPLLEVERKSFVYFGNRFVPYPIQSNLSYLKFHERIFATVSYVMRKRKTPENLKEFFQFSTGEFLTRKFMIPYNRKMWQEDPEKLPPYFLGRFVPKINIFKGNLHAGYNPVFYYPPLGIGEVIKGFLNQGIKVRKGKLEAIQKNRVLIDKKWIRFKKLYLTIPLPEIVKITPFLSHYTQIKFRGVGMLICLVGIAGKLKIPTHWVYFPQKELPFTRIGCFSCISKGMAPDGCSSIWIEIPIKDKTPSIQRITKGLKDTGLLDGRIKFTRKIFMKYAYPIKDDETGKAVKEIESLLERMNIFLCGRFAGWEYNTMSDAIKRAKEVT